MPRRELILTDQFPYHIFNRSNNREFFYLDLKGLWDICIDVLHEVELQFGVHLHLFVLMTNHYHLILHTPRANIGEAMKYFHREVARKANRLTGRINHFWGGRYKWSVIENEQYYWNAVKYVYRNPVVAGICDKVEAYKFSSLNRHNGKTIWRVADFFHDREKQLILDLAWLNTGFTKTQSEGIKKALNKRQFKISADKSGGKVKLDAVNTGKGTVT